MKNTPFHNLLVFSILAAAFALPATMLDKFQEYGPELLQNPSFDGGGEDWIVQDTPTGKIKIEDGILGIVSTESSSSPTVYQEILPDPDFPLLRLQGDLQVEDVVPGTKSWQKARLLLVQYKNGKAQFQIPHNVKTLEGTKTWQHYQSEFTVFPKTESLRAVIQMSNATGLLQAKNLSLRGVQHSTWYTRMQIPARSCFYIFLFYIILPYLRFKKKWVPTFSICMVALFIVMAISLSATTRNELQHTVEHNLKQAASSQSVDDMSSISLPIHVDDSKIVHFLVFILLGFSLHVALPNRKISWVFADIALFAATTEFIQIYIDGRSALLTDVLIDCSGGMIGIVLGKTILLYNRRNRPCSFGDLAP